MNLLSGLGYVSNALYIIALIIAIKNFNKSLSKTYLVFFGLTTVYVFGFYFKGKEILEWQLSSFYCGVLIYAGFIWACLTTVLAVIIIIQWILKKIKPKAN